MVDKFTRIACANGVIFNSEQTLHTSIKTENNTLDLELLVIPNLVIPTQILIGFPAILDLKMIIDCDRKLVKIDNETYDFEKYDNKNNLLIEGDDCKLNCYVDYKLPAYHRVLMPFQVPFQANQVLINSLSKTLKSKGLSIDTNLVLPVTDNFIYVVISNLSPGEVYIKENTPALDICSLKEISVPENIVAGLVKTGFYPQEIQSKYLEEFENNVENRVPLQKHMNNLFEIANTHLWLIHYLI